MLKRRIVPKLQMKERDVGGRARLVLVTSVCYEQYIEIGDPVSQAKIFQNQAADELIFLDIDASITRRKSLLLDVVRSAAKEIFMPFTVGGGVRSIDDFRLLLRNGSDKVAINTAAIEDPGLITRAAEMFGSQCVVVSIDARRVQGTWRVWSQCGKYETGGDAIAWAQEAEQLGAGEILITAIDRDGTKQGLDTAMITAVASAVKIPVIAAGGCGQAKHFVEGFAAGAEAVSAGTYFSFKDENFMQVRAQVRNAGVPIRLLV
jgi:imidazole glycerol-phosphate synthase subunit HisF